MYVRRLFALWVSLERDGEEVGGRVRMFPVKRHNGSVTPTCHNTVPAPVYRCVWAALAQPRLAFHLSPQIRTKFILNLKNNQQQTHRLLSCSFVEVTFMRGRPGRPETLDKCAALVLLFFFLWPLHILNVVA